MGARGTARCSFGLAKGPSPPSADILLIYGSFPMESTRGAPRSSGDHGGTGGIRGFRELFVSHLRSPRYLVWAGLVALAGIILCFQPLFDLLGFEWAFAIGLVVAPAAMDTARAWVHRVRASD